MARTRVRWAARPRSRWRRVAALAIGGCMLAGFAGKAAASAGSTARHQDPRTYVVHRGDTLWGIAAGLAGPTGDPRPVVDAIASLNETHGALYPGQILRVPRSI